MFYAGGFLYNPRVKEVLLHKRDDKTVNNPNRWSAFGGTSEDGETPIETFIREMKEELGLALKPEEVIPFCDYLNKERNIHRYIFYVESGKQKSEMTLGEGEDFDWIPIGKIFEYDLTAKTRQDIEAFVKTLDEQS